MAESVSSGSGNEIVECEPYMKYEPLPEGYVRLLKTQESPIASNLEEEVQVSMISVPLAERPSYITLSYTWGEPELFVDPTTIIFTKVPRCFPIKCRGRVILVTRNLRNALRRLCQYENNPKYHSALRKMTASMAVDNKNVFFYWIDAICINQEDLNERSAQVLLMSNIYRQAQWSMTWLGEQNAYTVPAVQVLLKIVGDQIAPDSFYIEDDSFPIKPKFKGIDTLDDSEITALAMLMAQKWISRTWFLHGASAPVILRPLPNGRYRFLGEAYVHGVMYGEAGAESTTHELI